MYLRSKVYILEARIESYIGYNLNIEKIQGTSE